MANIYSNKEIGEFTDNLIIRENASIKKKKASEEFYYQKGEDAQELRKIKSLDFFDFFKREYIRLAISYILIVFGAILSLNIFLILSIILVEVGVYLFKKRHNILSTKKLILAQKYLYGMIVLQVLYVISMLFFDILYLIHNSTLLSVFFLFDFYVFLRIYILFLEYKFKKVYMLFDDSNNATRFYVWKSYID